MQYVQTIPTPALVTLARAVPQSPIAEAGSRKVRAEVAERSKAYTAHVSALADAILDERDWSDLQTRTPYTSRWPMLAQCTAEEIVRDYIILHRTTN